jgi:malonate-semialdehyde dehydrogenase (acetylating)/methylmalonate-semialdehyde dehydrogenase
MSEIQKLKYYAGGKWIESTTNKYMDVFNPSTGEVYCEGPLLHR